MSKRIILLQALTATPTDVRLMVGSLPATAVHQRPDPDTWSVAEVLTHLNDVETRYLARLHRVVAEENPDLPSIHPDVSSYSADLTLPQLLTQFSNARAETIDFLKQLGPGQWQRSAVHQSWGETKLRYLVQELVNHDTVHLNQIIDIQQKLRQPPPRDPQPATS